MIKTILLSLLTGLTALCVALPVAAENARLTAHPATDEKSQTAYALTGINGQCDFEPRAANEPIHAYSERRAAALGARNNGLDLDCIIENYSEQTLIDLAKDNNYTAIYTVNATLIAGDAQAYCGGRLQLFGTEKIEYKGKRRYIDFLPDYYLFLARVKKNVCRDFKAAWDYYEAAEAFDMGMRNEKMLI